MASFSLCMIVKNEEQVLKRCLESLSGIFDQIVIVDTGSTDRTKEIASEYTDEVYDFKWCDDFSAARNFAFSFCKCDYIYSADADEVLDEKNRNELLFLKGSILPEVEIVQFWYVNTKDFQTTENEDKELRPKLFKRLRTFTWIDPVHESVNLKPVVYDSDIEILHMPVSTHSKRDFGVFKKAVERGEYLSEKIHGMYARELLISGEDQDFIEAEDYFLAATFDGRRQPEEINKAYIILAHTYRIENRVSDFFKWAMKSLLSGENSDICMEFGYYYESINDLDEAVLWYFNAFDQTKPVIDHRNGNELPLKRLADCYEKLAEVNELMSEYLMEEACKYRNMINEI